MKDVINPLYSPQSLVAFLTLGCGSSFSLFRNLFKILNSFNRVPFSHSWFAFVLYSCVPLLLFLLCHLTSVAQMRPVSRSEMRTSERDKIFAVPHSQQWTLRLFELAGFASDFLFLLLSFCFTVQVSQFNCVAGAQTDKPTFGRGTASASTSCRKWTGRDEWSEWQ